MAVLKLDLKRAGLVDDPLSLTRYERTHKWLQSCTDPSDSLEDTSTIFSAQSEVAAPSDLKSTRFGTRAIEGGHAAAMPARRTAQDFDTTDAALEQILSQVWQQHWHQRLHIDPDAPSLQTCRQNAP